MTLVIYRHGCPYCGSNIYVGEDSWNCKNCDKIDRFEHGNNYVDVWFKEVRDFIEFFKMATGFSPWSLQIYWIKRLLSGESFAMVAPTGIGKSTLLGVYALYRAYFYKSKVYIITPTREIAKQFYNKISEYLRTLSKNFQDIEKLKVIFYDSSSKNHKDILKLINENIFDILITSSSFLSRHHVLIDSSKIDVVIADDLDSIMKNSKNVDRILKILGFDEKVVNLAIELVKLKQSLYVAKLAKSQEIVESIRRKIIEMEAILKNEVAKRNTQLVVASATGRSTGIKALILKELLGFDGGAIFEYWRNIVDIYSQIDNKMIIYIKEIIEKMKNGIIFVSSPYKDYVDIIAKRLIDMNINIAVVKSGNKAVDRFRRGEVDVLIGPSSYYGILVRGLDEPQRIKFVIFIGLPQIMKELWSSLNNIRLLYMVAKCLNAQGIDLTDDINMLANIIQSSSPAQLILLSKALNGHEYPSDLRDKVEELVKIRDRIYREAKKFLDINGKLIINNYGILVKLGHRYVILKPDPYTYIQASGRCSRLFNGIKTFGISIVFEDHKELIELMEKKMKRFVYGFKFINLSNVDINEYALKAESTRSLNFNGEDVIDIRKGISTALIIVESPTKAKTIASMFGKPAKKVYGNVIVYESIIPISRDKVYVSMIVATLGHITDLVTDEGLYGVRIDNNKYIPIYDFITKCRRCGAQIVGIYDECPYCNSIDIQSSNTIYNVLKKLALEVDNIFIATDPDTEGEKIAFDIYNLLYPINKNLFRIEFREVTKNAILEALKNPRRIDIKKVKAQMTRRIVDRWIGFELSMVLQDKFNKPWLGAGRVQSPVLLWVVRRYKEYVDSIGYILYCDLYGYRVKIYLGNNIDRSYVEKIIDKITNEGLEVKDVEIIEKTIQPPPPFTTDSLLYEASNRYGYSASKVMAIAQALFEQGLITYHRTDSTRISSLGLSIAREALAKENLLEYYVPRQWITENNAEDAHEAIRPTNPINADELIELIMRGELGVITRISNDHLKIYDLIYRRFLASQMKPAKVLVLRANIGIDKYFTNIEAVIDITEKGFTSIYPLKTYPDLKILEKTTFIKLNKIFVKKGSAIGLYRVADLIRMLKEKGIGRPSTYAKAIDNNIRHGYIVLSKKVKVAIPTKLGREISEIVEQKYINLVGDRVTYELEHEIDLIERGLMDMDYVLSRVRHAIDTIINTEDNNTIQLFVGTETLNINDNRVKLTSSE